MAEQRVVNVCIPQSGTKTIMARYVKFVCARVFDRPLWLFGDWLVCVCVYYIPAGRGGGPLGMD